MSEQTVEALTERFGVEGAVRFEQRGELVCLLAETPGLRAAVCLQGAHVMEWAPAGAGPVLFLSERTEMQRGKAIRGGVPVVWPWFGPRTDVVNEAPAGAPPSPSHGFARTEEWRLDFVGVMDEAVHLALSLDPTSASRAWGFDGFRVLYRVVLGRELRLKLTVVNEGAEALRFEEALHSYYAVADAEQVTVTGLEGTAYLDKRDGGARKVQEGAVRLTGATDRVYLQTEAACVVHDAGRAGERRELRVEKHNSGTTVVWNPWSELTPGLKDVEPEGWRRMLAVETANTGEGTVVLQPGESHVMGLHVTVSAGAAAGEVGQ